MIPDDRMEKALTRIAEAVEPLGRAAGRVSGLEHRMKMIRSQLFLDSSLKTVAEREAHALANGLYKDAVDAYQDAVTERDTLRSRIKLEELVIECWRTQQASNRRANVL